MGDLEGFGLSGSGAQERHNLGRLFRNLRHLEPARVWISFGLNGSGAQERHDLGRLFRNLRHLEPARSWISFPQELHMSSKSGNLMPEWLSVHRIEAKMISFTVSTPLPHSHWSVSPIPIWCRYERRSE